MILRLNGLSVRCIIGDLPAERKARQTLRVDVAIDMPGKACLTDDIAHTADYAALAERVTAALVAAECRLLERAAKVALDACRSCAKRARAIEVTVTKRGAVRGLESASVTIGDTV